MGFCALDLGSFRSGSSRIDLDRFLLGAIGLVDGVGYSGAVDDGLFRFRSDRGLSGGSGRIRSDEFRSDGSGGDGVPFFSSRYAFLYFGGSLLMVLMSTPSFAERFTRYGMS